MKRLANPQAMADVSARDREEPDTWLTPRYILEYLGDFDLDPCASHHNPTWVCDRFFTEAQNGLNREWIGRVFMNPPFSDIRPWIERHAKHESGISLIPASVESQV